LTSEIVNRVYSQQRSSVKDVAVWLNVGVSYPSCQVLSARFDILTSNYL
jgi:hypothetical protein